VYRWPVPTGYRVDKMFPIEKMLVYHQFG